MNLNVEVEADELEAFLDRVIKGEVEKISNKVLEEISTYTLRQMRLNYIESEFQPGEEMSFYEEKNGNEITDYMSGAQAWYSEFGTGTRGRQRPHPMKDQFNLDDYNSHIAPNGTIRRATKKVATKPEAAREGITVGTLYWTYKAKDGEVYYTKGIPSQRQVYTAGKAAKKKLPEIIERNMKKVF